MSRTFLEKERYIEVISMYKLLHNTIDIAAYFNVSNDQIRNILARENIIDLNIDIDIEQEIEIVNLYRSGFKIKLLSDMFHLSPQKLRIVIHRQGVLMRDHGAEIRKYNIDEDIFKHVDCEEKAYILGLLIADGCNDRNKKIKLSLNGEDEHELLKQIRDYLYKSDKRPIYKSYGNGSGYKTGKATYCLMICNSTISEDLNKIGVCQNKTYDSKYPYNVFHNDMFFHFLRGFFDGDGCVYGHKSVRVHKEMSFTGTDDLLTGIRDKIEELLNVKIHTKIFDHPKSSGIKIFRISHSKTLTDIYHMMYDNASIFLKRKKTKFESVLSMSMKG